MQKVLISSHYTLRANDALALMEQYHLIHKEIIIIIIIMNRGDMQAKQNNSYDYHKKSH